MNINNRTASTYYDAEHENSDGRAMLEIRTYHSPHSKALMSSVRRIRKHAYGTREAFEFGQADPVPPQRTPVARHSEKALRAAHEAYIAEHNLDDPATLAPLIEWAKEAK